MRAQTRHSLKQDKFSKVTIDAAEKTVTWTREHKNKLTVAAAVVVVAAVATLGTWYYFEQQDQHASVDFSQAIRTLDTPLRPPNMPAQPDQPSFTSAKDRASAAHKQFQAILNKYPHTHASQFARYFAGVTAADLDDTTSAERDLKEVSSYHNKDLAALGKFALASLYRKTGRDKEAIELYKELIEHPRQPVGKATAQLELAGLYEQKQQPQEAKRILERVQKENPNSEIASIATQRLGELK